jgi:hypothetical protein
VTPIPSAPGVCAPDCVLVAALRLDGAQALALRRHIHTTSS